MEMENLRENLEFFSDDIKEFQRKLEDELDDLSNKRAFEREQILRVTTMMKTTIQRKEEALLAENEHVFSQHETSLEKSLDTSKQIKNEIASLQSHADDVITSKTRDQLNEGNLQFKYDTLQERFATIQNGTTAPMFKPVDEDLQVSQNMDIGMFERCENVDVELSAAHTIEFSAQRHVDMANCFPTGMLWTNKKIVITDKSNKKVKFFTENGEFLSELLFTDTSPYGVCSFQEDSFAVTLPKVKQIYLVTLRENLAKVLSNFQTYFGYAGLCKGLRPGSMVATVASNNPGESQVDIIGFKGEVFLSFKNDPVLGVPLFKFPRYVLVNQGVIIISDWRKDCVIFLHEATGNVLKEYRGTREHPLVNPYDLSIDAKGNVYVMNGKNGTIHVLDIQCKLIDVIKETSELLSPRLICYDNASGRMAVSYGAGDIKTVHHRAPTSPAVARASNPPHSPSFLLPPEMDANARCPSPGF